MSYCFIIRNDMREGSPHNKFEGDGAAKIETAAQRALDWLDAPKLTAIGGFTGERQELEGIVDNIMLKAFGADYALRNTLQSQEAQTKFGAGAEVKAEKASQDTIGCQTVASEDTVTAKNDLMSYCITTRNAMQEGRLQYEV